MKLPNKLHISEVEALVQELSQLLDSEQALIVDISDVEQTDTASLQAFCALQKSLSLTGNKINWAGDSKAFKDSADMIGVTEFLNLA
jgi:anti-anti-sigma regulatory factor